MNSVMPAALFSNSAYNFWIRLLFLCIWRIVLLSEAWQSANAMAPCSSRCKHWSAFISGALQRGQTQLTFCLGSHELLLLYHRVKNFLFFGKKCFCVGEQNTNGICVILIAAKSTPSRLTWLTCEQTHTQLLLLQAIRAWWTALKTNP